MKIELIYKNESEFDQHDKLEEINEDYHNGDCFIIDERMDRFCDWNPETVRWEVETSEFNYVVIDCNENWLLKISEN
jgi:hypothetical protein